MSGFNFTTFLEAFEQPWLMAILALVLTSWLAIRIIPVVLHLAHLKDLMDEPDFRKVHKVRIPNLGGVGIFVSFTVVLTILASLTNMVVEELRLLTALLSAVTILFFLGVKDDMVGLSPAKKFSGQTIAALMVILVTDLRIHSLEGLLGVGELPYLVSVLFSLFVFLLVINAYNLIDGIDGLAGTVSVIASVAFGTYFVLNEAWLYLLVSFALVGAVRGFLKFNFSHDKKCFMGDSGSMVIGFLLAFQAIGFLTVNGTVGIHYPLSNAPIVTLAILSFPLLDTLRVFLLRAMKGHSPFRADKNHIHHRLLALGMSHKWATASVALFNLIVIGLAFALQPLEINIQLLVLLVLVPTICLLPTMMRRRKGRLVLELPRLAQLKKVA